MERTKDSKKLVEKMHITKTKGRQFQGDSGH